MKQMVKNWKSLQSLGKMVKGDAENNVVEISDLTISSLSGETGDEDKMVIVNENGELGKTDIPSGGTKLYKHTIEFAPSQTSGNGKFNTFPFYVISSRETPYILNELEIIVGNNAISMSDDNSVLGSEIYYVSDGNSIICIDALGDSIEFQNVSEYTDNVTEL